VISDELIAGATPSYDGPPGSIADRDVLGDYGEFLRSAGGHLRTAPVAGGRRRRQRHGRSHHAGRPGCHRLDHAVALYFELDGSFPNHEANPLDPANLLDLQAFVLETGADIGLAFDGDADRCFVVDERGLPVSPSTVTSLVAARELGREIGATVIYNVITSRACPNWSRARRHPLRSRVGHSYIKGLMAETGADFRR